MPAKLKSNDDYNGFVKIDIKITSPNRGNTELPGEKFLSPLMEWPKVEVPPYN